MSKPTLTVTSDFTEQFNKIVKQFKGDSVLVGIPEVKTERRDDDGNRAEDGAINNATILAINEFGSPQNNIPPRPVMSIGIRSAQGEIAKQFKLAAQNALTDGYKAVSLYFNRAGIIASNAIKKTINAQTDIDPPSAATLRTRESQGFKGTKALIVTGQMRNAITYVVKE